MAVLFPIMDLPTKYHPRKFEDMVGQPELAARLGSRVLAPHSLKIILHGPTGTGKTTAGQIIAQARLCDAPEPSGSPCRRCGSCIAFERGRLAHIYRRLNAADDGRVVQISKLMEMSNSGKRLVVLMDEVHQLAPKAADLLLPETDAPPKATDLILCTSNLGKLQRMVPPLVDRFDVYFVRPVGAGALLERLNRVAAREGIPVDDPVAMQVAELAGGSVRAMLRLLGALGDLGGVSKENLEACFAGRADEGAAVQFLLRCVEAPSFFPVASSVAEVQPEDFREAVETALGRLFGASATAAWSSSSLSAKFMDAVDYAAQERGIMAQSVWEQLITTWERRAAPATPAQVLAMASATYRLVGGTAVPSVRRIAEARPTPTKPGTARSSRLAGDGQRYLSKAQARAVWRALSAFTQKHGVTFNAVAEIVHRDEARAAEAVSAFTHRLGLMAAPLVPGQPPLAWAYVHGRGPTGQAMSRLALYLPSARRQHLARWVREQVSQISHPGSSYSDAPPGNQVAFQIEAVRGLCGWLDPHIWDRDQYGNERPLIELLGVPKAKRGSLGTPFSRRSWGISKSVSAASNPRAGEQQPLDPFIHRAWHYLDLGWELWEHQDRLGGLLAGRTTRNPYLQERSWPVWWKKVK